jgi:sulfur-carrier protein adenylyltransferase/sulfurtransferase
MSTEESEKGWPESAPMELSVETARRLIGEGDGWVLLDTRSPGAFSLGHIPGALSMSHDDVTTTLQAVAEDRGKVVLVYCSIGVRSAETAQMLRDAGYRNACSLAGGFSAWRAAGLQTVSESRISIHQRERYSRNMLLKEVGEEGQLRLMNGSVLVVGAGGLASSAALYLAACGVGTIGIVDFDVVEPSNLNRQILHGMEDIGRPKVDSAKSAIGRINPDVNVIPFAERLTPDNALRMIHGFDIVMDACDNIETKYLLNDACYFACKPYVFGGAVGFDGQAGVFWPREGGPCLRCLFPKAPPREAVQTCSEAGVLGVVPGQIGLIQATEVIKLILKVGTPMIGRFYVYDALNLTSMLVQTGRSADCPLCGERPEIKAITGAGSVDYQVRICAA